MATRADVRRIALALPETTEETWYTTPGYKVRGKGFLRLRTEAEGGLVVFVADLAEKQSLLDSDPDVYFTTDHYAGDPILLVHLNRISKGELTELITESWRVRAPAALRRKFDAAE